jgi:hypothetical protein
MVEENSLVPAMWPFAYLCHQSEQQKAGAVELADDIAMTLSFSPIDSKIELQSKNII